ncbi:hypothetical protein NQ997_14565 [Acinetobacter baumannii]|nr:hypothetical protein [Acinetobacter baumannii]MDC4897485.1 hypothetical protein [Acinetobacter baumannii]MDC4901037.1 hypothetical protein [Acinetobacter baumannii]MDC4907551.1 hypothetical protein [Acinetobacter baumannii]MDC4914086.1 hypothetical protein [Acinetobacter baumannii]
MTTMFIDTNGEMSFVDNERLKFIMHYLKQGADDSLVEIKDGRFVHEDSELSFTEIWLPAAEHQQTKIDEQQAKVEELQKRVQFLEQELGAWKGKSIAAMINGMCGQCGKEPWQAIVSDKEGYALLHCFGCGANKYELVGEQALKGEG